MLYRSERKAGIASQFHRNIHNLLWDGKIIEHPLPTDDYTRGIMAFNDYVMNDPRVEKVILPIRDGFTVIRKK